MRRTDPLGLILLLMCALPGSAQDDSGPGFRQQAFPAWMNESGSPAADQSNPDQVPLQPVAEPAGPVDPDPRSGPAAPKGPGEGGRFRFTPPTMPDFSKFRRQGQSSSVTQTGSGTQDIRETSLGTVLPTLASAAALLPGTVRNAIGTASQEAPKANIPARFYRPTGYSSFLQESRRANDAEAPAGSSASDTSPVGDAAGR
ncbi:MAG TPA: hypothetical protein PLP29_02255 [Candidatus Ozemobacteraceae bacterium]|nr:hypothetical protein [Candidatus Ozemobacteraceae bacterium]